MGVIRSRRVGGRDARGGSDAGGRDEMRAPSPASGGLWLARSSPIAGRLILTADPPPRGGMDEEDDEGGLDRGALGKDAADTVPDAAVGWSASTSCSALSRIRASGVT